MYALELEKNWTEIGNYTVTLQCVVIVNIQFIHSTDRDS